MNDPISTRDYILALAGRFGIRYERTPIDDLADVITHLSDDEVEPDDIQDLLQALHRAGAISKPEMVDLLHRYLTEKYSTSECDH
ncbi:hypothetical protein [Marinobacter goseongensis]|uniref:hypothetical protein n=1 Tax=Marinobacter goseongensis TaxID=453838 RepID=UPI002005AF4F|nr:hypothetical protein [Marinobacter goseongensis]